MTLVVALLVWQLAASGGPAPAPPDARYTYSFSREGSTLGTTTIILKRDAGALKVHESATTTAGTAETDEELDAGTLVPTSYRAAYAGRGETAKVKLTFDADGATEMIEGKTDPLPLKFLAGTTNDIVLDGALMSGFLLLPAQVHVANVAVFSAIAPIAGQQVVLTVDGAAKPDKPATAPAGDSSLSVSGPVPFIEWYDPTTFVVDELDVPSQQFVVTLSKRG